MFFLTLLLLCSVSQNLAFAHFENNACRDLESYPFADDSRKCFKNPDFGSNVSATAKRYGYPVETYHVTTSDGYILTLFRILPKKCHTVRLKSPIFIQHGMAATSNNFVSSNKRSLAFNLADLGHDIWLGNLRGSTYSKKHVNLTVNDSEFWNFSYREKTIDVREQLKFVAKVTRKPGSIIYIGHSLGNAVFYIYALEYPEEASSLVQGMINLAPAIYHSNSRFFRPLAPKALRILKFLKKLNINVLFHPEEAMRDMLVAVARKYPDFGKKLSFVFSGNSSEFPTEDLLVIWKNHVPSSVSVDELMQIYGSSLSGVFSNSDYGHKRNLEIYGSEEAPVYNLTNIKIPAYIFCGDNDVLVDSKDCKRVYEEIGSRDKFISRVPRRGKDSKHAFNHLDFAYGRNLKKFLYDELLFPILKRKFK